MGLLTSWLAYRAGKRSQQRRHEDDDWDFGDDEICVNCGHRRAQHSDQGSCPRYD